MGRVIEMARDKQSAVRVWLAAGFAVLAVTPMATAQNKSISDDEFASIPLEYEVPDSRARTPRPEQPTTEPTRASTTEPAELEALPYLTGDWNGWRRQLIDKGITLEATATLEETRNFSGGIQPGNTGQYLFDLYLTLDTDKLLQFKGGTFFVDFQSHGGESASQETVGDWQWLSNIDSRETTQISELWYQQSIGDGVIKLKVGKIDVNGDFAVCDFADNFLNSGMGYPISDAPLPTYPDPAFGVDLVVTPNEHFAVSFGVFDGSLQEGMRTGRLGPATLWGAPSDLFFIAEVGTAWNIESLALPGSLIAGATYHTGTFDQFNGGTQNGAAGAYATFQQRLWRENPSAEDDPQGVACFLSLDWSEPHVSEVDWHCSIGATWTGAIPNRDEDVIGLGVSTVWFNKDAGFTDSTESAVEAFYKLQLAPSMSTWFDVQYIVNPGGTDADNALVGTVRLEFSL